VSIFQKITGTVAKGILTRMSRKRLPKMEWEIILSGLLASVEVIRDRWGVPHIYVETVPEPFYAQDRLILAMAASTADGKPER